MSKQKIINEKNIYENLNIIFSELRKKKIKFWLDGGALLRFSRGFKIYSASDYDIGTEISNINKIIQICKNLEKRGFKISLQNNFPFFCDLIKIYFPKPLVNKNLDIYLYYKNDTELIRPAIHKPRLDNFLTKLLFKLLNKHNLDKKLNFVLFKIYLKTSRFLMHCIPIKHFNYKIKTVKFHGLVFGVPNHLNNYLEYRYGNKWKRFNKNWNASDGKFLRIRKLKYKIKFYVTKDFTFKKFKSPSLKRNYKFNFSQKQIKKIINLDEK